MSLMRPMSELREQMDKMFQDFSEEWKFPNSLIPEWRLWENAQAGSQVWFPPIEFCETEKAYVVRAQIPGGTPEDIHVEVNGDDLIISGETRVHQEKKDHHLFRSEFRYGRFLRRIQLPGAVVKDNIKAGFTHGILEVTMPKQPAATQNRVKIDVQSK